MAQIKTFALGSKIHVTGSFTNSLGVAADPDSVFFQISVPTTGKQQFEYGVDPEIVKESTGNYYIDWNNSRSGTYFYRWISTGVGQAAEPDGSWSVSTSKFGIPGA